LEIDRLSGFVIELQVHGRVDVLSVIGQYDRCREGQALFCNPSGIHCDLSPIESSVMDLSSRTSSVVPSGLGVFVNMCPQR
jgi:hypothetical protein